MNVNNDNNNSGGNDRSSVEEDEDDDYHDRNNLVVESILGLNLHFQLLYKLEKQLGKGGYGTVWSVRPTGDPTKQYAAKIMELNKKKKRRDIDQVYQEVRILKGLQHLPNVVPFIDFVVEPRRLYVVLGYAKGGDLFDYLRRKKKFTEKNARDIAVTLLRTLHHIHSKPHYIVHRDLKPENLLLSEVQPVDDDDDVVRKPPSSLGSSIFIADFGFAKQLPPLPSSRTGRRGYLKTRLGTPTFVAPEIVLGIPYRQGVDMWSMGCILYMLMCGYPPFQGGGNPNDDGDSGSDKKKAVASKLKPLFYQIRAGDYTFHDSHWKNVSIPCKRLIAKLLRVDPKLRSTAQGALNSEWIQDIDDKSLSTHDLSESFRMSKTTTNSIRASLAKQDGNGSLNDRKQQSRMAWKGAMHAVKFARGAKFWNPYASTFPSIHKWVCANVSNIIKIDKLTMTNQGSTVRFRDIYTVQNKIMDGSTATVYQCQHNHTKELYAVKIISRMKKEKQRDDEAAGNDIENDESYTNNFDNYVLNEVAIMQSLSEYGRKYVVQVIDFYEEPDYFYVVMDLMNGGDVLDRLYQRTKYTEEDAKQLIKRLLEAVACMHSLGIAHRDLKPQNLLLTSKDDHSTIKVADFGFSRRVHTPESLVSRCGTPTYVAPEILKNIPHDERCDLWSVGVIVYILLVGYPPFMGETQAELFRKIRTGDYRFYKDHWKNISKDAQNLVRGLLVVDPEQRWTAEEALRCSWIQNAPDLSHVRLDSSLRSLRQRRERVRQFSKAVVWQPGAEKGAAPVVAEMKVSNIRRY